jgi:hypothetical protein
MNSSVKKPAAIFLDKASLYPDDLNFSALDEVAQWQWFDNANVAASVDTNINVSTEEIQHALTTAEILGRNKV